MHSLKAVREQRIETSAAEPAKSNTTHNSSTAGMQNSDAARHVQQLGRAIPMQIRELIDWAQGRHIIAM
jgi:hypothetical protein